MSVPEPSVLLFIGIGLVAVGIWGSKHLAMMYILGA